MPVLSFFFLLQEIQGTLLHVEYFETETANLGIEHINSRTRLLGLQSPLWAYAPVDPEHNS